MEMLTMDKFEFLAAPWPMDKEKQTLILVHGAGMNYHSWEAQIAGLSAHANVLALSLPGHGTRHERAMASIEENVNYLVEFIDKVQIKDPAICGLSMGGAIVLALLARGPGNIKAGIVINSGARLQVSTIIFKAIQDNYGKFLDTMGQFALSPKNDSPEIRAALGRAMVQNPETALRDFMACNTFNLTDDLHCITAPLLILTASDDLLTPVKYGEHLKAAIPHAELVCIEDAGHLSPMERPQAVNREIKRFIELP